MEAALAPKAAAVAEIAAKFGTRLERPLAALKAALPLSAKLAVADSPNRDQADVDALYAELAAVEDLQEVVPPSDLLHSHITAVCECTAALGFVFTEDAAGCVATSQSEIADALAALRAKTDPSNAELADAVTAFLAALATHIGAAAAADAGDAHSAKHLADFREMVTGATLANLKQASVALGEPLTALVSSLAAALAELYNFIVAASKLAARPSDDARNDMLAPIAAHIGAVSAAVEPISPRDPLFNHAKAVEDSMGMLSWVVADSKPVSFVSDAEGASAFSLDKILMGARRTGDADKHKPFVKEMKAIFAAMRAYIKEYFPTGLEYGLGVDAPLDASEQTRSSAGHGEESEEEGDNYVSAFAELISTSLGAFLAASSTIGGDVDRQARIFAEAWAAEKEFLAKAYVTPKPADVTDMLTPIGSKMGEAMSIAEEVDPRGPFGNHCKAVGESIAALGWVAVDEKATAFVGDNSSAGQFYIDKVKMGARSTDNPDGHRKWAAALETLYAELKAYVKEHHTQCVVWNPPKAAKKAVKSRAYEEEDDDEDASDYVSAFKAIISGPLAKLVDASKQIGGEVAEQSNAFSMAWEAEAEFLAKAINMPKPDDVQGMLGAIAAKMGEVGAISEKVDPRGPYSQHCSAVSESISALGWVAVDEKATSFVGEMSGAGQFYIDKVKMGARKTDNPDVHRTWATSLEALYAELKAYVKEHHTQKLTWNPPKAVKKPRARKVVDDDDDEPANDYVSAFQALITGPLAAYSDASKAIGGAVAEQSDFFVDAWKAEAAFLSKAINMPKPDDVQSMLGDIAAKMGEVSALTEKVDLRGPLAQHCQAVSESIGALGWVAVDEKATAFVGDMSSAGQFFMDKVKMGARKTDDPDAHRKWAASLETLYSELKAYVKEHHTQQLVWNPPKAAKKPSRSRAVVVDDDEPSGDYVSAFEEIVKGPLETFAQASKTLGGEVAEQCDFFVAAWRAEAEFLSKAISMPKPADVQPMLASIADMMGKVAAVTEKADPRGPFFPHCNAVSESISALGWVAVDEKAAVFVSDMAGAGQFFMDKVKMGARQTDNPEAHRSWAKALEALYAELKAYVKEHHTQQLVWNPPKAVKRVTKARGAKQQVSTASDYVSAFNELLSDPLAKYVSACGALGGDVERQAKSFAQAWEAEAEFLGKAITMKKPADIQEMLTPISSKMAEVMEIAESADPRGPLTNHLTAVSESIGALGWIAVDEKATAFVGDTAGAGQFFVDKVKMSAKRSDNPEVHRAWASALETLYADLKAYVKEHHTQRLSWKR